MDKWEKLLEELKDLEFGRSVAQKRYSEHLDVMGEALKEHILDTDYLSNGNEWFMSINDHSLFLNRDCTSEEIGALKRCMGFNPVRSTFSGFISLKFGEGYMLKSHDIITVPLRHIAKDKSKSAIFLNFVRDHGIKISNVESCLGVWEGEAARYESIVDTLRTLLWQVGDE